MIILLFVNILILNKKKIFVLLVVNIVLVNLL